MKLLDTHAHLDSPQFEDDLEAVLLRAADAGVCWMICPGSDLASSRRSLELARRFPDRIRAAVGIHPNRWADLDPADWHRVEELAEEPDVVAIGETGLDFHHEHTPRARQEEGLRRHMELARRLGLPLIVHARRSDERVLELLAGGGNGLRGVRHCYDRPWRVAEAYLELGFHLGIGGAITRPGYRKFKAALARVPLDRLLLETDCPYQSPASRSGQRNEPAHMVETLRAAAKVRGTSVDELAAVTTQNAERLFSLARSG